MVGTSLDGLDAAVVALDPQDDPDRPTLRLLGHATVPLQALDAAALRRAAGGAPIDAPTLSAWRPALAADSARALDAACARAGTATGELAFVASHGVTLFHAPAQGHGWQLSGGPWLATRAGVPVVDDFRAPDLAAGGQGAPLAPLCDLRLHAAAGRDRGILNLGGIANLSLLPAGARAGREVVAGDVGPANLPMDDLVRAMDPGGPGFDRDGALAARGEVDERLLRSLLSEPWVDRPLPRSFGREEFGAAWQQALRDHMPPRELPDLLATLVALQAEALARFVARAGDWRRAPGVPWELFVTGGGRHNPTLIDALGARLRQEGPVELHGMEELGIDPDAKEAVDFALLGWLALAARPAAGEDADRPLVLGSLHWPHAGAGA